MQSHSLPAPHPLKRGPAVTVCKSFSLRNFDWIMFTGYASVMTTLIQLLKYYQFVVLIYFLSANPTEIMGSRVHFCHNNNQ